MFELVNTNANANQSTKIAAVSTNSIIPTLPNIMMSGTCHARRQAIDRRVEVSRPNNKISSGVVDSLNQSDYWYSFVRFVLLSGGNEILIIALSCLSCASLFSYSGEPSRRY
ncbi:hypothetical protein TNCT_210431 [Trichonephila clavata]|uniref:Uncharacterized protein n=1 Tax=Trichonephila clavata TaxID=2740835 RepID=A0A8X6JQY8_TRICU|nr:hypothetical protein TNCT_210431 [Trichonephila clavata]